MKRSTRARAISEPGEDVYFKVSKVDIAPSLGDVLYRNQVLLDDFLADRRLSSSSEDGYRAALTSFSENVVVPLGEAGELDMRTWYRKVSAKGLTASTIAIYAYYVENALYYALRGRGLGKSEAKVRTEAIMEGVPLVDLRREMRLRSEFREMLILPEELSAMWRVVESPRVKAFIAVDVDSACRKGELLSARVRDLTHRSEYSELRVLGKTGERTLPLTKSVPVLMDWLKAHPDPRPGAPLFATVYDGDIRFMNDRSPNKAFERICLRAGIRRIRPHQIRHTTLTDLARAGIGEYVLKKFAGWTPNSKMAAKYIHLSGQDHIPAILRLQGVTGSLDEYTRDALETARGLMKSENEETRVFALETFLKLNKHGHVQTTLGAGSIFREVKW